MDELLPFAGAWWPICRRLAVGVGMLWLAGCVGSQGVQRVDVPPISAVSLQAALVAPGVKDAMVVAGRAGHEGEVDKLLGAAIAAGNPVAQRLMGDRYCGDGHVSSTDLATAVSFYRRAAAQGYGPAEVALGKAYRRGKGVAIDKVEAVYWYRQAAQQGDHVGQVLYGVALLEGDGVPQDKERGAALIEAAARVPDAEFQINLSLLKIDISTQTMMHESADHIGILAAEML